MTVLLIVALLIAAVVWALIRATSGSRVPDPRLTAIAEAHDAVHQFAEQLHESREEIAATMEALRAQAAGEHRGLATARSPSRASALNAVLEMKASPPDPTRREGYWRTPPAAIVPDDLIVARMNALAQLGQPAEVCFTGWTDDEKAQLRVDAIAAGCTVRTNIAKHLTFLCVGETPGPMKVEAAEEHGVVLISGDQFDRIICGGEAKAIPF
ncbi:MAG TPA: hypothetical protein VGF50_04660 [Caulobacteraceae bacterium]